MYIKPVLTNLFLTIICMTIICIMTASAHAQGAGSGAAKTGAENPDATFVQQAAQRDMAEVALSKVAVTSASSPEIRAFAQTMVHDHTQNNKELATIAAHENIAVPRDLDSEHAQLHDMLENMHGADFDDVYVRAMREDHQKMIDLLKSSAPTVSTEELRTFIKQTLPVVQGHLSMANDLKAN